jgi:hypothetical protein
MHTTIFVQRSLDELASGEQSIIHSIAAIGKS